MEDRQLHPKLRAGYALETDQPNVYAMYFDGVFKEFVYWEEKNILLN